VPKFLAEAEFTEQALMREKSRLWDSLPDTSDGWFDTTDLISRLLLGDDVNWGVHGSREAIERITVADAVACFSSYWLGSDMVLSAAGSYSRDDLSRCVEQLEEVASHTQGAVPLGVGTPVPRSRTALVPVPDDRFSLHLLFPGARVLEPGSYLLRLLDCIVGGTPDARVPRRLSWDLGLADASYSTVYFVNDRSVLEVYVEGGYERFHDILRALVRSVESLTFEPPSIGEVQEAQTVLTFERDYQLDDPQNAALSRGSLFFASGAEDPRAFEEASIGPGMVTPDGVFETAQRVLSWDNLSVLYVGPEVDEVVDVVESTWPYKPIEIWGDAAEE